MKRKAYIYVLEKIKNGKSTFDSVLPFEFTFKLNTKVSNSKFEEIMKRELTREMVTEKYEKYLKESGLENATELIKIEPVFIKKKSKFYEGEYFAHEYDLFARGKVRRIEYSNGFYEYEVLCLNPDLNVLDGMYSEEDRYGDRYDNGYGDYFETYEMTPWTAKERGLKRG